MSSFNRTAKRVVLIGAGLVMFLLGLFGVFFGVLAIFDPAGAQMSNDADPFGEPPTLVRSIALTGFYLALAIIGGWLFNRGQRASSDAT